MKFGIINNEIFGGKNSIDLIKSNGSWHVVQQLLHEEFAVILGCHEYTLSLLHVRGFNTQKIPLPLRWGTSSDVYMIHCRSPKLVAESQGSFDIYARRTISLAI